MTDHESETRKRRSAAQLLLDRNALLIHTLNGTQSLSVRAFGIRARTANAQLVAELQKVRTEMEPTTAEFTLMQELKENTVSLTLHCTPQV